MAATDNEKIKQILKERGTPGKRKLTEGETLFIYRSVERLTNKIAITWNRQSRHAEMDDLMQVGFIGVHKAIQNYDAESVATFSTYAAEWINSEMSHYAKKQGGLPEYCYKELKEYKTAGAGDPFKILAMESYLNAESIDKPIPGADGLTVGDTLQGHGKDAQELIEEEERNKALYSLIDELPTDQRQAVKLKYLHEKSCKGVALQMQTTEKQAQQTITKGIEQLRNKRHKLSAFYDVYFIERTAYKKGSFTFFRETGESATEHAAFMLMDRRKRGRA